MTVRLVDWGNCLCGGHGREGTPVNPRCPEHNHARDLYLRRIYGITLQEYWAIFDAQDGKCALCGKPSKDGVLMDVDHDHVKNFVRGLLHRYCNHRVIGRHRDPDLLFRAAEYLRTPPAVAVLGSGREVPKKKKKRKRRVVKK